MADFPKKLVTNKDLQDRCSDWVESQKNLIYDDNQRNEICDSFDTDSEFDSVSECGGKRRRMAVPRRLEGFDGLCGWLECNFHSNSMEKFVKHVGFHVSDVNRKSNENETITYGCKWIGCSYETDNSEEVARHINYHSFHIKLQCIGNNIRNRVKLPKCRRDPEFQNAIDLPPPLLCRWEECLQIFLNYQLFLFHVAAHICEYPKGNKIENGVICKWTGCNTLFPSIYKLREHIRRHTKEKVVACPDCGGMFASNTKFYAHCKRQIPIDVQGFQCSHCNKFYPTEGILRDHMRMHVFNYKCTLCEMSCESPASLAKHVRYRHVSTRSFPCQLCEHSAKSQQDLDSHMTVHTQGPNFKCHFDGCTYCCKGAYTLDRHIERVHGRRTRWYRCHECPMQYRKSHRLTRHLTLAHKLQLPSGHRRFQYTHEENGCYRLQMVRYEAVEDEEREENKEEREREEARGKRYAITVNKDGGNARVEVLEVSEENDQEQDEDDPTEKLAEKSTRSERLAGKSMPVISSILISIEETDEEGNVIKRKIVETQETTELPASDGSPIVLT